MEELKKEVRVSRRIKMLHCPSKVEFIIIIHSLIHKLEYFNSISHPLLLQAMDLENEIKTLRKTFSEKSVDCVNLLKEVCVTDASLRCFCTYSAWLG